MKRSTKTQSEKGQSLVELALILFFVLVLLAGLVDLGRMMYEYLTMRDAAQEGAGYGAVYPNYCGEISTRVTDNLPTGTFTVNVQVDGLSCGAAYSADVGLDLPIHGCENKELIVAVDHNFDIGMPFLSAFTGPTVPMHVEIKDRIVRPECGP